VKENLTARTKDKRTAGYDFCYSVPKSVSVYLALSGDRAVKAHRTRTVSQLQVVSTSEPKEKVRSF
jgi:hypothetical protein